MYDKHKLNALDITHFLGPNEYQVKESFSYADIPGKACICGYQIIFFYIENKVEALSIEDDVINNAHLLDKANQILRYLGFNSALGSSFVLSDEFSDNYIFKDSLYEGHIRYYCRIDEQLIILGLTSEGILVSFEIISNQQVIENRLK